MGRQGSKRTTQRQSHVQALAQALKKVMRGFGRRCRGHGHVYVKLVRHTEPGRLERGAPITRFGQQAHERLAQTTALPDTPRERLRQALTTALCAHAHSRGQSQRPTQGKKLAPCTLVQAYDLTMAPISKGKSHGPAPCGRKPGIASEPARGFIFATLVPHGNPSAPSDGLPWLDKVQRAIDLGQTGGRRRMYAVARALGLHDPVWRQALHDRGILTVGIPKTVEPIAVNPDAHDVFTRLQEAGWHRIRTPQQVPMAGASGPSRPVVESHIASVLARGAGYIRYKGLAGAVVQQGMTVMAHNGAVVVRIRQQQLSKRAQKFRRMLGLTSSQANEINNSKN